MFKATQEIAQYFKTIDGLKVYTDEDDRTSRVWLSFSAQHGGSYRIQFISRDDGDDVAVRVFGLASVTEEKRPAIITLLNDFNNTYRFAKFCCTNEGSVDLEYDLPQSCSNTAAAALETLRRFNYIIDDCYPKLMRAVWL